MSEKLTGYLLLVIGLIIMIFSVVNIIMVFTNKAKPFSVFNLSSGSSALNINDILSQIQKNNPNALDQAITPPKLDILPPEVLNQTLNLSTHFFLISFILGFGYKLANLGVQLIRPINVRLKSHLVEVMNNGTKEIVGDPSVQSPTQSMPSQPIQPIQPPQN